MIHYLIRMVVMLLIAFPLSVAVSTVLWRMWNHSTASWNEQFAENLWFLSVGGAVTLAVVSLLHTWSIRQYTPGPAQGVATAVILGLLLGGLLGLSTSFGATLSIGMWGALAGLIYGFAVWIVDHMLSR